MQVPEWEAQLSRHLLSPPSLTTTHVACRAQPTVPAKRSELILHPKTVTHVAMVMEGLAGGGGDDQGPQVMLWVFYPGSLEDSLLEKVRQNAWSIQAFGGSAPAGSRAPSLGRGVLAARSWMSSMPLLPGPTNHSLGELPPTCQ